jgi:outer membrane receptor protein involved in Fe transport
MLVVASSGKQVPDSPQWLEKFVLTGQFGDIEAQLAGDFVGKRYATFLNELWVDPYFITSLNVTSKLPSLLGDNVKNSKLRLSITNLTDVKGDLNVGVGVVSGSYTTFPIEPRQFFLTYSGSF